MIKTMTYKTALKQAKEGKISFCNDIRFGINYVQYQTPSGQWRQKTIDIVGSKI
jgi:hypothetical protein